MPKYQNDLVWTNINVEQLGDEAKAAAELFWEAKQGLEAAMLSEAQAHGVAQGGDSIKMSTTKYPVIGIAVVKGKAKQGQGWGSLQPHTS